MVEFDSFVFSSSPYTGAMWFVSQARCAGLNSWQIGSIYTPPVGCEKLFLTIVRHPYTWLKEFYHGSRQSTTTLLGKEDLISLARETPNFGDFVHLVTQKPNVVWGVFRQYNADTVILFENLTVAAQEFFESAGVVYVPDCQPQSHYSKIWVVDEQELCRRVTENEPLLCEAYNYL